MRVLDLRSCDEDDKSARTSKDKGPALASATYEAAAEAEAWKSRPPLQARQD